MFREHIKSYHGNKKCYVEGKEGKVEWHFPRKKDKEIRDKVLENWSRESQVK